MWLVFVWTRCEFGDLSALFAVFLFTTLPVILAFSSVAYTDMAAGFTQGAALLALVRWLQRPSWKAAAWLGCSIGLALLAKFTTLVYLPAAAAAVVLSKFILDREGQASIPVIALSYSVIWPFLCSWRGSWSDRVQVFIGGLQQQMHLSAGSMPSFQHFPGPLRPIARNFVLANPSVPHRVFSKAWLRRMCSTKARRPPIFWGASRVVGAGIFF